MGSKQLPKKNVSFRGMAKQLVSYRELEKGLKEAKSLFRISNQVSI